MDPSNTWSRAFVDCPHCGLRVLFDPDGVCPACRVAGDAPVTPDDERRIAAERMEQGRRALEASAGGATRPPADVAYAKLLVYVGVGLLVAHVPISLLLPLAGERSAGLAGMLTLPILPGGLCCLAIGGYRLQRRSPR